MEENALAGYFPVVKSLVFFSGEKEGEERRREGTVTHATTFRAVRWQML